MQKLNFPIASKDIYILIRRYWHIKLNKASNLRLKLSELGLSTTDINLMLNSIEWKHNVKIGMETVLPQVTLNEFVKEVTSTATPIVIRGNQHDLD
jgi:hypothetical protein